MVQDALNAACAEIEGCETIAFVDLSTRMALMTNQPTSESQDALVKLVNEAVEMLGEESTALVGTGAGFHLFLRAQADPSDALCCILKLGSDLKIAMPVLRDCLETISKDGAAA